MTPLERYHARRAAGLCGRCGEPTDGALCPACREVENAKRRALRKTCVELGICPRCRKHPLMPEHTACAYCFNAATEKREANKERLHDEYITRRNTYVEQGLCIRCGKHPHAEGRKQCEECLKRERLRYRERIIREATNGNMGK